MNDAPPPLHPAAPQPYYHPQPQPTYQPPPRKSGCGCAGAGCGVGCLVAVIAGIVCLVALGIAGKKWLETTINEYTSYEAQPVVAPQATPEQIAAALAKAQAFRNGMDGGGDPVPLVLTGEELNLVLWNDPEFSQLAGKAEVGIEEDQLHAKVSIPLDDLPLPKGGIADMLKGKYFNGELGVRIGMESGQPALYLDNLAVNGAPVPEMFMSGLRSQNLLEEALKNPEGRAIFDRIEDIRVEGGRLTIIPKTSP